MGEARTQFFTTPATAGNSSSLSPGSISETADYGLYLAPFFLNTHLPSAHGSSSCLSIIMSIRSPHSCRAFIRHIVCRTRTNGLSPIPNFGSIAQFTIPAISGLSILTKCGLLCIFVSGSMLVHYHIHTHGSHKYSSHCLVFTGAIATTDKNKQVLDKLQVERERGITVKAQTASLFYKYQGQTYLLNLIDTPGHVDFSYEVSRSISACQGVLLIVDANQGIQAQTVANFYLAFEAQLTIIPVINKIDLKNADPERVEKQIEKVFDIPTEECIRISAKLGTNVEQVLQEVVKRLPPPTFKKEDPFKALVFDSNFDHYRGVVANIALFGGYLSKGDRIISAYLGKSYEVNELGLLRPDEHPTDRLYAGQVGYVIAGMKEVKEAQIGDTLYHQKHLVEAFPGFKPAKAMVFAGMYPMDQSDYSALRSAVEKLTLNDSSVTVQRDSSLALGAGWRLGFLGLLHMEVFNQRLEQEYNASVIVTAPTVPYKAILSSAKLIKEHGKEEITIVNPAQFPDRSVVKEYLEPMVMGTIITPDDYIGKIMSICLNRRAVQKNMVYIDDHRVMMKYLFPLNEIVVDFYDLLKSMSSGYASFDYEDAGYQAAHVIKMDILLNGKPVEELTTIVHKDRAYSAGKAMCERLQDAIPRQMFEIAVQAAIGSKVIARETIKAYKKNVLAKCYGGDITRKMKLLKKQAEGKKKMRYVGTVQVPKDAFINVLKRKDK
uniref:GTP binding elongation factor GUF1 n=1 Tax=Oncorhynchus kisutch TaxID=8019 RepID=A0A8C7J963_ONCKI